MNRITTRLLAIASAIVLALPGLGCDSHVLRKADLAFEDGLPQALTTVTGTSLRLTITHLEHPETGYLLTAWAHTPEGASAWVELGEVDPGEEATFDAQALGFDWAEVTEVVVSEEVEGAAPTEPSSTVCFHGEPGGALEFGGPDGPADEDFHHATATMSIEDMSLEIHYEGLPALSPGFHYGAWLLPEDADHHHAELTASTPAGRGQSLQLAADGGVEPVPEEHMEDHVDAGPLDMSGHHMFQGDELLATFHEVVITVELDHGHDEPALDTVVMRAEIPTAVAAAGGGEAAPPAEHSH